MLACPAATISAFMVMLLLIFMYMLMCAGGSCVHESAEQQHWS